jgi:hypothetical protein
MHSNRSPVTKFVSRRRNGRIGFVLRLDLDTGFGKLIVGQQLTPTDAVVSITPGRFQAGRSGCAGVADVGRQGYARRLEQRADDADGGPFIRRGPGPVRDGREHGG